MNLHELGGADKLINRFTVDLTPDVPVVTDIRLSQELRQPPGPAHACESAVALRRFIW